jgi:hypothetical protein
MSITTRITTILVFASVAALLNSCVYFNLPESIKEQQIIFDSDGPSLPEQCRHLYNIGMSEAWMDCMGVGLK